MPMLNILQTAPSPPDVSTLMQLCASDMTELLGGGLVAASAPDGKSVIQTPPAMLTPHVRMLNGGTAAVASCERPRGTGLTGGDSDSGTMVQETRVWEMQDGRWKCVHSHTSPSVGGR